MLSLSKIVFVGLFVLCILGIGAIGWSLTILMGHLLRIRRLHRDSAQVDTFVEEALKKPEKFTPLLQECISSARDQSISLVEGSKKAAMDYSGKPEFVIRDYLETISPDFDQRLASRLIARGVICSFVEQLRECGVTFLLRVEGDGRGRDSDACLLIYFCLNEAVHLVGNLSPKDVPLFWQLLDEDTISTIEQGSCHTTLGTDAVIASVERQLVVSAPVERQAQPVIA